jgi:hypothetical protein
VTLTSEASSSSLQMFNDLILKTKSLLDSETAMTWNKLLTLTKVD